jgi:tetratricopeptide (TPR) repeat protein
MMGRIVLLGFAAMALAIGAVALGIAYAPEQSLVAAVQDGVLRGATSLASSESLGLPEDLPTRLQSALQGPLLRFGALGVGAVLLILGLLPGGGGTPSDPGAPAPEDDERIVTDKRLLKKARKLAAVTARRGQPDDAAEICFASGLMDEAAGYFVDAKEFVRAAEIRHDQNRFRESAELYLKGGKPESAGVIFSQEGEPLRAAEAYLEAGKRSVAAEMFEEAEDFERAATCYEESGFARHAAQAYVTCKKWERAAACLEEVMRDEGAGAAALTPQKQTELDKLVRMTGDLYARAGREAKAEAVLEKGGCFVEAGEIALRNGRESKAADLFLKGKEPMRAADVLRSLGEEKTASRVLAEYHRDRGEEEPAARFFEDAGEHLAAADLYRSLENYQRAAECYELQGESAQAAEMFRVMGERSRAAENYERAGQYSDAAECYALAGDEEKEAELLVRGGDFLRAGEIHHRGGRDDDAIGVLQQIESGSPDYAAASALLGDIFRGRGMLSVALTKLKAATEGQELSRENIRAFYTLATAHEASEQIEEANTLYEKVLACDYHYQDVEERLERTRGILQSQTAPTLSAPVGPMGGNSAQEGRYRITGTLGRGGMGIVYKAKDSVLDRIVALKVLPEAFKENPQALKNFLREAKSAAQLNHPNIVTVYDAGEQDGVYYIAMEYVDGKTLKEIVKRRGKIAPNGAVHVMAQLCEALAYAHDHKIVHRDIKNANIMWTRDKKSKVMDFGLAKVIEEVRGHTTVVSGTPYYMSPEQTLGKNVDHRTDIYSLGVSIFELSTGLLPFREGNMPYHHVHTPPPDPRDVDPEMPEGLANVINRCLEKDPDNRYQTTREILADLKNALPS